MIRILRTVKSTASQYEYSVRDLCQRNTLNAVHIWQINSFLQESTLTAFVKMMPYSSPYLMLGRVTFQKTCQSLAPMVRAASSSARSMVSRMGMSSLTTKGIVTNRVARAIPARMHAIRTLNKVAEPFLCACMQSKMGEQRTTTYKKLKLGVKCKLDLSCIKITPESHYIHHRA